MDNHYVEKVRYELFVQKTDDPKSKPERFAGYAFMTSGEGYYVLRLSMFPTITYFLAKSTDSSQDYCIFSRAQKNEEGLKLLHPVGYGASDKEDKTFLRLKFHLLDKPIYMSLFPIN